MHRERKRMHRGVSKCKGGVKELIGARKRMHRGHKRMHRGVRECKGGVSECIGA